MTIIKSIYLTTLFTLLFTAGAAQAAGNMGSARGPISFSDFDKNGDGMISREEFSATQRNRAETQTETRTQTHEMNGRPGTPPVQAPAAGMGVQNQEQMQEQMRTQQRMRPTNIPAFAEFDQDSDGSVTQKEFYSTRNIRIRARVLEGKQMRNMSNAPSFSSIDSNGDKLLSEEEFNAHQDQHAKMWEE
jgi:Ca2+-binding EF-hand superfamily protein